MVARASFHEDETEVISGLRIVPRADDTLRDLPLTLEELEELEEVRAAEREPEWAELAWRAMKREVGLYFITAWEFAVRPRATAEAWAKGRFRALNPAAYLLNSVAIYGPWRAFWQWALRLPDAPLYLSILWTVAPFFAVIAGGGAHHFLFRANGSTRRFTSNVAMSVYLSGGLPMLLNLAITPFQLKIASLSQLDPVHFMSRHWRFYVVTQLVAGILMLIGLAYQNAMLVGLHGTTRRRTALLQFANIGGLIVVLTLWGTVASLGVFAFMHFFRHGR